jgi:hypothetical protein
MPTYAALFERLPFMSRAELLDALKNDILAHNGAIDDIKATLYLNELHHRDADEQTKLMLTYTRRMLWLTVAVTVLTVVDVALVAYTVISPAGR